MATVQQIKTWVAASPRDWDQVCQALMYQVCLKFGAAPVVYTSANAARAASTIVSTDAKAAPPGAFHYWSIGTYGHVGLALGNGYVFFGTKAITDRWGINAGVNTVDGYTKAKGAVYKGWARSNGKNTIAVSDSYGGGTPTATQRKVGPVLVKRRSAPSSQSAIAGEPLEAGTIGNFNGWITGESVSGNSVWFRGISGHWFWSGGFTDTGTHDLANLNPVVIPKRTVGVNSANRRAQPSTLSPALSPAVPANTTVEITGFAKAQQVGATNIWFKSAVDGNWMWSGGFTSQDTAGLPDLTATVVVPEPIKITTFGIDVSGAQKGIDFVKAKADGVQFVIVKMGGHNTANQTVSPEYASQVDAARKAGLKIGHYYVTGKGDAIAEADFFVRNLHDFSLLSDVLVLDNELFDTNGGTVNVNTEFWSDSKVATFFERVKYRTGIPYTRLWHYSGAAAFKSSKWPLTEAKGVKVWWAAYGNNPTDRHPQELPILGGAVSDWWVHQFSSKQKVAGWAGDVDGNWSRQTLDELFAVGAVSNPVPEKPDNSESVAILEAVVAANEAIAASAAANTALLKSVIENLDDDNY